MTETVRRIIRGAAVHLRWPLQAFVVPYNGNAHSRVPGWVVAVLGVDSRWHVVRSVDTQVEAWAIAALPDTEEMLDYTMHAVPEGIGERVETVADIHRRLRR